MRRKTIFLVYTVLTLSFVSMNAHADDLPAPDSQNHILYGSPACEPPIHTRIDREIYVLCNNAETKFAD